MSSEHLLTFLWLAWLVWFVLAGTALILERRSPAATLAWLLALHLDWQATGVLWLTYGFMGAAFALVYWRTRTLWAPIAAHALNNAVALALVRLHGGG